MLGILDMDVDTCILKYEELAKRVFQDGNKVSKFKLLHLTQAALGKARFDHSELEDIIEELIKVYAKDLLPATTDVDLENLPLNFRGALDGTGPKCKVYVE